MNWRNTEIHFGKNKGVKLGELPAANLKWYAEDWMPKPYKGKVSGADQILRVALDACMAEREERMAEKKLADAKAKREEIKNNVEQAHELDYSLADLMSLMRYLQLEFGSGSDAEQAACATVFIQATRMGLKAPKKGSESETHPSTPPQPRSGFAESTRADNEPETHRKIGVGRLGKVETKTGTTRGREWQLWSARIDGEKYVTFDAEVGESLERLEGEQIEFVWVQDGKSKKIVEVEAALDAGSNYDGQQVPF